MRWDYSARSHSPYHLSYRGGIVIFVSLAALVTHSRQRSGLIGSAVDLRCISKSAFRVDSVLPLRGLDMVQI